jgi:hypothetical protein
LQRLRPRKKKRNRKREVRKMVLMIKRKKMRPQTIKRKKNMKKMPVSL